MGKSKEHTILAFNSAVVSHREGRDVANLHRLSNERMLEYQRCSYAGSYADCRYCRKSFKKLYQVYKAFWTPYPVQQCNLQLDLIGVLVVTVIILDKSIYSQKKYANHD